MSMSTVPSISGPSSPVRTATAPAMTTATASMSSLSQPVSPPAMTPLAANTVAPGVPLVTPQSKTYRSIGDEAWRRCDKVNGEMFVMTYGAIVAQLCRDLDNCLLVNGQLFKMGYNMGIRLIEDFLAKSGWARCGDFRETVQVISHIAFKMFLNCTPRVVSVADDAEFGLVFSGDGSEALPLLEFVHLPEELVREGLLYANILPGLLKGALEMIQMDCDCWFVADQLRGDDRTELRLRLNRIIEEELPPGE